MILRLLATSLLLLACACSSTKELNYSGYLSSYNDMRESTRNPGDMIWDAPHLDLSRYTKIHMPGIEVFVGPESEFEGLTPGQLQQLADRFKLMIYRELNAGYRLVQQPGPDVMTLRIAFTEVVKSRATFHSGLNVPSQGENPTGLLELGEHVWIESVDMEAELVDSQSGQRLASYVGRRFGTKSVLGGVTGAGHIEDTFRTWATDVRVFIDTVRSGAPAPE